MPRFVVIGLFLVLGTLYALFIPPGETPDEPAHLGYADYVVAQRDLPPLPVRYDHFNYESHQPPLDYLISAAAVQALNGGPLCYPFTLNRDRSVYTKFASVPTHEARRRLVALRIVRLFWGVITIWALFVIVRQFVDTDRTAIVAVLPFALAPQFLFISASINNDVSVIALASLALALLIRSTARGSTPTAALLAGVVSGLAISGKASGIFLGLPVVVASFVLRREKAKLLGLLSGYAVSSALFFATQYARFSELFPPVPRLESAAIRDPAHSLLDPMWLVRTWKSSWANFGWLDLDLPIPTYLLFVPVSIVLIVGIFTRREEGFVRGARSILDAAALALFGLYIGYLLFIDWQLQGRYLFPALGSAAVYTAVGLGRVRGKWMAVTLCLCSVIAAALGALRVATSY